MKFYKLIGIMSILVFSFYLTDFVTELAINSNPLIAVKFVNSAKVSFIAPVEIALITFAPIIFCSGYGLLFASVSAVLGLTIMSYMIYNKRRSKA